MPDRREARPRLCGRILGRRTDAPTVEDMAKLLPDMVKYLEGPALEYAVSELFKDPDSLAFAAADHGSPRWLLDKIAREGGAKLAVTVAANPSTSGETLEFITNCGKVTAERAAMAAQRNRKLYPGGMKSRSANTRGDVFDCVNRIAEYMRRSGAGESQLGELTESLAKALQSHVEAGGKINEGVFGAWEYLNMGQIALCCAKIDPNDGGGTWLGEVEELFRVALYELEAELELAYEHYPNDLDTAEHSKELKEKLGDIKETAELLHASLKGKETRSIAFIAAERTSENEVLAVLTGKPGELDNLTAALAYTRADASFKVLDVVANLYSSGMPPGILRLGAGYGTKDHAQHVLETGTPQNFFEMLADGDHDWKALLGKEELAAGIKSAAENLEWVEYFVPKEPISRLISEETAKAMIADASPEVYEWLFAAAAERRWLTVPASFNPNMDGRRWAEELWGEVSLEDVPKMSVRSLLEIRANRLRGSAGAAAKETAVRMLAESTGGDLVAVLALNGAADTFPGSVEDLRNFVVEAARQPVKNVEPTAPLEAETKTPKRRTGARKTSPVERGRAAGPA